MNFPFLKTKRTVMMDTTWTSRMGEDRSSKHKLKGERRIRWMQNDGMKEVDFKEGKKHTSVHVVRDHLLLLRCLWMKSALLNTRPRRQQIKRKRIIIEGAEMIEPFVNGMMKAWQKGLRKIPSDMYATVLNLNLITPLTANRRVSQQRNQLPVPRNPKVNGRTRRELVSICDYFAIAKAKSKASKRPVPMLNTLRFFHHQKTSIYYTLLAMIKALKWTWTRAQMTCPWVNFQKSLEQIQATPITL
mmetsp:Transcript_17397/g.42617  ORF Transcript_17397/g.42617 Transcript_17397/m.42617 type:complete len:245 (+) Transcript_17397:1048-1782(+)